MVKQFLQFCQNNSIEVHWVLQLSQNEALVVFPGREREIHRGVSSSSNNISVLYSKQTHKLPLDF